MHFLFLFLKLAYLSFLHLISFCLLLFQSDSGEDEPLAKFCKRGPMKVQNAGRKCTSVQNRSKTQLNGDQQHSSSAPAASAEKAVNQQRSSSASAASAVIVVDQQRSSPASAAAAEKLVDRSKVGAKRKLLKEADKDIADLVKHFIHSCK